MGELPVHHVVYQSDEPVFADFRCRLPCKYRIRVRTLLRRSNFNVGRSDIGHAKAGSSLEQALHRGGICSEVGGAVGQTHRNRTLSIIPIGKHHTPQTLRSTTPKPPTPSRRNPLNIRHRLLPLPPLHPMPPNHIPQHPHRTPHPPAPLHPAPPPPRQRPHQPPHHHPPNPPLIHLHLPSILQQPPRPILPLDLLPPPHPNRQPRSHKRDSPHGTRAGRAEQERKEGNARCR